MKKHLLMCLLALGFMSSAQITYNYGWEPTGDGGWTTSGSGSFGRSTTTPCTGTASMRANNYYNLSSYLVSPALTGTNGGDLTVNFNYKVTQYSSNSTGASLADFGYIKVEWATNSGGPWTTAYTIDNTTHTVSASCASKTAVISGVPSSGDVFIRFDAKSALSTSDNYVYFDDISITQGAAPSCLAPNSVTGASITTATANISWAAPTTAPASGYELYYSTSPTAPTSTTTPNHTGITGTTRALSGLAANTQYYVWVRSNCTATDKSLWSPMYTFTTPCTATNVSYTLDFESVTTPALPSCTLVVNNGTGNAWKTAVAPTGYGFTGNALNYSYNSTNAANTWFFTQGINLTAGTSYRIKYKYANSAGTTQYAEKMKVAYGTSAASAAMTNTLADYPNIITNGTATNAFVDFVPTTTGIYYFGFQAYSALDMNQLYVDDINVDVTPSCTEPSASNITALTSSSATLGWIAPSPAPANGYEYYYSTTNTAPTSGTTTSAVSVPLSPLAASTTYYYWVRSKCTASNSVWITGSFTTPATPPANDNCSGAIALTPGGGFAQNAVTGTTIGATLTSDTTATTACQTTRFADTWYSVVVPASGSISIETRSVTGSPVTDTVLGVYSGTCGSLVSVGCDDDSSTDGNFSLVTLTGQTPGSTLLIGVWNYNSSNNGTFQVSAYDASLATSEAAGAVKNNIKAYPNPFADVLNISDVSNVKSIYVMDVSGKLIKTFDKPEAALQLRELNSGMYLVVLNMKDGSKQTIKAIKK